ncbi:MAG: NAD(P)H-binding protein, partial [Candidatus Limosilactobacillus intestinavium]
MTKVMIIGATGSIARVVAPELLKNTDAELVLASRRGSKRVITDASRETAIKLDVNDEAATAKALAGVDFVFASLSGSMDTMAKHLIAAMD